MAASAALVIVLAAAGCSSAASQQYTDALSAWDSRQYATALAGAREAQRSAESSKDNEVRDKSAYLAGLAAFQLGKLDDASRSLAVAAASSDRTLAGKATAMQGALALEQSRWSDASALYSKAATLLPADEAAVARTRAKEAEARAAGVRRAAGTSAATGATPDVGTSRATKPPTTPSTKPAPAPGKPAAIGTLTIVAGTYSSEVAARQRASTLTESAKRAGLGTPRVVPASAPDRRVWIVEIGSFADRTKADAALKQIPATGCAVAPSQAR